MKKQILVLLGLVFLVAGCGKNEEFPHVVNKIRPPAAPLIMIDPYTNGWSSTNKVMMSPVKHWTGKEFPLLGVIYVDGVPYRFLGEETPVYSSMAPATVIEPWSGKYVTDPPLVTWLDDDYDDSHWKRGPAAFGTMSDFVEADARTNWMEPKIWVRREVNLPRKIVNQNYYLIYSNDDKATFYLNDTRIAIVPCCNRNAIMRFPHETLLAMREGKNVLSAYCHNSQANGLLDFGILMAPASPILNMVPAEQTLMDIQATQTHYTFTCGPVDLTLTFTAPFLLDNLELVSRPINYISYSVKSRDEVKHNIQLTFKTAPHWALDSQFQKYHNEAFTDDGLLFLKTGSTSQKILGKKGDDVRIDWGQFYMVAEKKKMTWETDRNLVLHFNWDKIIEQSGYFMVGYDDIYSVQYFGENLRPYWNRDGNSTIEEQFHKAFAEYDSLMAACEAFDNKLMHDAMEVGGEQYADLCAVAYRQAIAAHKLVRAPNGELLWLSKENFSNGSIGTVDVTYPSAPLFLYYNVELAKGLMNHIFYYSESGRWTKPFAAHDVGTYPIANGQTYGGDMPVEESGNMLILSAAIAAVEGHAEYAERHWETLTTWVNYLVENGMDPENQLCTDDFAGHFAHNANLSIKAIMGIASYGYLANMLGKQEVAKEFLERAQQMALDWEVMAYDGDHYKLTFDQPGTWSLKYNLIWDKLLGTGLFADSIAQKELAFYLTKQKRYGLPLDSRKTYSKSDWIVWSASLANDTSVFREIINPLYHYVNETLTRVPMSDWFWTDTSEQVGFQARSVVGGYFIKLLEKKLRDLEGMRRDLALKEEAAALKARRGRK